MNQAPLHKIPTNIISGFLGSGKTTAINYLIANKPADERWAILVNEFGQVGIDESLMPAQEEGLFIRELAGGCICCALGPALTINLAMLLRKARPHRLLIEPTGLGHPAGIVDILQGISFADVIDLRATICLLDPAVLEQPDILRHPTFIDQLNLADVILLNRCDLSPASLCDEAESLSRNMFPPKQQVLRTEFGVFPLPLLDLAGDTSPSHNSPAQKHSHHKHEHEHEHEHGQHTPASVLAREPLPGQPQLLSGSDGEHYSYGWKFHREDIFEFEAIRDLLDSLEGMMRIKAAINIGHTWISYNRVFEDRTLLDLAWRRDSRFELICRREQDPHLLEALLLSCLRNQALT